MSAQVLLVVPWLQRQHQALVFPDGLLFERPEQQTECIRGWVAKRAGFEPDFEARLAKQEDLQEVKGSQAPACSTLHPEP